MFRGRYIHTIDTKGRISIPARFREFFTESEKQTIVLTNFDRCLVAYPANEWEKLERKASALPQLKPEVKAFHRYFISGATECTIDRTGRVLIPPALRDYAALEKEIILVGMLKKFEIWSATLWQEEFQKSQTDFEEASNVLGDLGI